MESYEVTSEEGVTGEGREGRMVVDWLMVVWD